MVKRTKTSKAWMHEHVTDPFVKAAKREGYRSRAAYKLIEIDKQSQLFKTGQVVVDLGAAPGGWSQIAKDRVGDKGRVIAVDILPMIPLQGVEFLQIDFTSDEGNENLIKLLNRDRVDIVISDMAPNISGITLSDQARALYLAEIAMYFAIEHLKPGANFLVKLFHGGGFDEFIAEARKNFQKVAVKKPDASRDRSNEVYLLGIGKKTA